MTNTNYCLDSWCDFNTAGECKYKDGICAFPPNEEVTEAEIKAKDTITISIDKLDKAAEQFCKSFLSLQSTSCVLCPFCDYCNEGLYGLTNYIDVASK